MEIQFINVVKDKEYFKNEYEKQLVINRKVKEEIFGV